MSEAGELSVNLTGLLEKLLYAEQSIGVEPLTTVRERLIDAEEYLLKMQAAIVQTGHIQPPLREDRQFTLRRFLAGRSKAQHQIHSGYPYHGAEKGPGFLRGPAPAGQNVLTFRRSNNGRGNCEDR